MSDALPLPPRPNLEQYKKLAKDLQSASKSGDSGRIREWAARWAEMFARLKGVEITPEIRRQMEVEVQRIEPRWRKFQTIDERARRSMLAGAQFFVARSHGFA